MVWVAVGLCFLLTLLLYLAGVRNINAHSRSFSGELCELFLLKHMMKKNHPLNFMYFGLPFNRYHPRLLWPVLGTFGGIAVVIISMIVAVFLSIYGLEDEKTIETVFFLSSIFATILYHSMCYCIPTLQNNRCYKVMLKMSFEEVLLLRIKIEEQWPGFFNT